MTNKIFADGNGRGERRTPCIPAFDGQGNTIIQMPIIKHTVITGPVIAQLIKLATNLNVNKIASLN